MIKKNVWNAKAIGYRNGLTYEDFVTERKDGVVVRFDNPINQGAETGWQYKNLVTKDIGSDKIYLAWIRLEPGGGHDYHAHSGVEIIYVLGDEVQFSYRSRDDKDIILTLKNGDTTFVPPGTPHSVWNLKDKATEFLVIKSPPYFLELIPLEPKLREIRLSKGVMHDEGCHNTSA